MTNKLIKFLPHKLLISLSLSILMAGCAAKSVTFNGAPVTDPTLKQYAIALEGADLTIANITRFLIVLDKTDRLPSGVLSAYRDQVVPVAREAISTSKAALIIAVKEQSNENMSQVHAAILVLNKVLTGVVEIARRYGW